SRVVPHRHVGSRHPRARQRGSTGAMKALMEATDYLLRGLLRFARFLGDEVRSYPGRANIMLRCVLASAIVITAAMTLQVPFLALSLVVVFFVTQSNVARPRL